MKLLKQLISRVTYWLAWKFAGQRIWTKAVMWAATHIYLYSVLEKRNDLITLPEGITVTDEPVILRPGMTFDGGGHYLTDAVNKRHPAVIVALAGEVKIVNTVVLGHGGVIGSGPETVVSINS